MGPPAFPALPCSAGGVSGGGGPGRLLPLPPPPRRGWEKVVRNFFSAGAGSSLLPSPHSRPAPCAAIGGRALRGPAPGAVCEWGRRRGRGPAARPRVYVSFFCAGAAAGRELWCGWRRRGRGRSRAERSEAGGARLPRTHSPQRRPSGAEPRRAPGRIAQ